MAKVKQTGMKRSKSFSFLKKIIRLFVRRPSVNILGEEKELINRAIYIGNHSGASGPFTYELYFPKTTAPWGAYQMAGKYKVRWKYLYHIFYRQKLKYGKCRSWFTATIFAVISKLLYSGLGYLPTYPDARLLGSIKKSIDILHEGYSVGIFPEDSSNGYKEYLEDYNHGFVTLSKLYYKKYGEDLPVYNIYYSKKLAKIVVAQPVFINKMLEDGMNVTDVANYFVRNTNHLYTTYILDNSKNK